MSGDAFMTTALQHGSEAWVRCHVYDDDLPILTVWDEARSLAICAGRLEAPRMVTDGERRFAQELVEAAQTYRDELERIALEQERQNNEEAA